MSRSSGWACRASHAQHQLTWGVHAWRAWRVAQAPAARDDDAEPTKLPIVAIPNGLPTRYKGLSWAGKGSRTLIARLGAHRIGSGEQFKHGKTSAKKTQAEWKQVRLAARARGARPPRWRTRCFFF